MDSLRDGFGDTKGLVRPPCSSAVAANFQDTVFVTKQITDGLDGDTPQIGKLLGAEVFVLHQVGLLHTFDRCRGRDWLPLDEFLGSTKQGYQVVPSGVRHGNSIPNPLRARYTNYLTTLETA